MHRNGKPLVRANPRVATPGPSQQIMTPSLALYDRREQSHIPAAILPIPEMRDGDRLVKMSPDRRQGLCYQCHAAPAGMPPARATTARVGRPRRPQLHGLPPEARPADARLLRHLPPAPFQLRPGRREDGHHLQGHKESAQYPLREMRRLPPQGDTEEEELSDVLPNRDRQGADLTSP